MDDFTLNLGDVIQVINPDHDWYACLLIVDEIKEWGVQAGMKTPYYGVAFIRLLWKDIKRIGQSEYYFDSEED